MNHYLFDREGFLRYYNCSYYDVNIHPIEERRDVLYGIILIAGSLIFEVIYIPIIPVLWQSYFRNLSCYKLMSTIAIVDILAITFNGILTGYLAIIGAVYCTCPTVMLFAGTIAFAAWLAESDLAVLLALDRCLNMLSPKLSERVFDQRKTNIYIGVAIAHSLVVAIFTDTMTFSSLAGVWLLNPHFGYPSTGYEYTNILHHIHNISISFALAIFYLTFTIALCFKKYGKQSGTFSFSEKPIFVQVLIMSFMNFSCALIYVYEQHFPTPKLIMQFSQFGWMCIHGLPSIIYLSLNKSIRRRVFRMMKISNKVSTALPAVTLQNKKNATSHDNSNKYEVN